MAGARIRFQRFGGFAWALVGAMTQESTLHAFAHRRAEGGKVLCGMVLRRGRVRGSAWTRVYRGVQPGACTLSAPPSLAELTRRFTRGPCVLFTCTLS